MKNCNIESIEIIDYEGDVYNLELESSSKEDDLFWIEANSGVVTHNCFPKDLAALIHLANQTGFDSKLMKAVQSKNLDLVPPEHRDWEKMLGRAFKKRNSD